MKKFIFVLALVLVAAMALGTGVVALATSGTAPYNAEINSNTTVCDPNNADDTNHTWKHVIINADCEANSKECDRCTGCGLEKNVKVNANTALGHNWDLTNAVVKVKATCTTAGVQTVKCLRCGVVKDIATTEGGHNWTEYGVVTKETCINAGTYKRYCTICGEIDVLTKAATGKHVFDHKYVKNRASCDLNGTYEGKCSQCGAYFTYAGDQMKPSACTAIDAAATADGTIALKIAARGHKWSEGTTITQVTCQTPGVVEKYCLNDSTSETHVACHQKQVINIPNTITEYNPAVKAVIQKYHKLVFVPETTVNGQKIGYYKCTVTNCTYKSGEVVEYKATAASTSGSKSSSSGSKTSSSTNKKGVSIPKTNDTTSNLPYVLIAVAFVGLVALVASKKKVNG